MNKPQVVPTNQLHDINWGALDHVSRVPQLMSGNYYLCVCVCVCVRVRARAYAHMHECIRRRYEMITIIIFIPIRWFGQPQ